MFRSITEKCGLAATLMETYIVQFCCSNTKEKDVCPVCHRRTLQHINKESQQNKISVCRYRCEPDRSDVQRTLQREAET